MAWIAVAGLGVSAAGSIFSAVKGAKANKANQALVDSQNAENKSLYDNNANKSFLETNVAKDAVKQQTQALESDRKEVAGRAAVTGASDEAKLAGNTQSNQTFQNGLSRLAANATQYQNQQEAIYRGQKANLNQMQMGINSQKAESAANLGQNAGELASTALSAGMFTGKLSSKTFDPTYGRVIKAPKGEKFVNQ